MYTRITHQLLFVGNISKRAMDDPRSLSDCAGIPMSRRGTKEASSEADRPGKCTRCHVITQPKLQDKIPDLGNRNRSQVVATFKRPPCIESLRNSAFKYLNSYLMREKHVVLPQNIPQYCSRLSRSRSIARYRKRSTTQPMVNIISRAVLIAAHEVMRVAEVCCFSTSSSLMLT